MKSEKPDIKSDAKMKVLEQLRDLAHELMGHDLSSPDHMQQVSVAAPDQAGLQKGLGMASQLMDKQDDEEGSPEEEMDESPEEASAEGDEDPQDLDRQIAELMAKKAALQKKA